MSTSAALVPLLAPDRTGRAVRARQPGSLGAHDVRVLREEAAMKDISKPQQERIERGVCQICGGLPLAVWRGKTGRCCVSCTADRKAKAATAREAAACGNCKERPRLPGGVLCGVCARGEGAARVGPADASALKRRLLAIQAQPDGAAIIKRAIRLEKEHRRALLKEGWRDEDDPRVVLEALERATLEVREPEPVAVEEPPVWERRRYWQYMPPVESSKKHV